MAKGWPGPGAALSQPCHLPRELSPSWESSSSSPSCLWHGAGRLEHPRPLLILIPPGPCISQSRTTVENRARAWFGTPGMETPVGIPRAWCQPWLGAGAAGPSLCPGPWLHPALGPLSPAEPKPQQNPRSLLPHLAQRGHQEPLTGTTHIPRPPWLISPALGSRAKGFLHPPLSLTPSVVLGTKSHLPPLLLSRRSPCPGLCQPGLAALSPLSVPGLASCGSHFPNPVAKGCPGAGSAPLSHTAPIYSWQLPGLHRAGMTQAAPCAVGWMNNLCS